MKKEIELQAISLHYNPKEYNKVSDILKKLKYPKNKLGGIVTTTYSYIICNKDSCESLFKSLNIKNVRIRTEIAKTKCLINFKDVPITNSKKIDELLKNIEEMQNS